MCRGPDGLISLVGLSAKRCSKDAKLLSEEEVNKLRNQTPGDWLAHSAPRGLLREERAESESNLQAGGSTSTRRGSRTCDRSGR